MRHKKPLMMAGVFLVLTLALLLAPALAKKQVASEVPLVEEVFTWQLSNARVVSSPQVGETPEGILITDYIVEAVVASQEEFAPVTQGKFRLTATVFSPKADMVGQRAGYWYLRGTWTVTEESTDPKALKARYGPGVVKGSLSAELSFNPLTQVGAVTAQVRLPMLPQGGRWGSGEGIFSGSELLNGEMTVTLNRRLAAN